MANSQQRLDVNTASVDELQTLPGIGRSRAKAIIEARQVSISNFASKLGIGVLIYCMLITNETLSRL